MGYKQKKERRAQKVPHTKINRYQMGTFTINTQPPLVLDIRMKVQKQLQQIWLLVLSIQQE